MDSFLQEDVIALDAETEEFSEDKQHAFELALDGLGLFSKNFKAYIPAKFLDRQFQQLLDKAEILMHNSKFDLTILEKAGYDISKIRFHDTLVMAWLTNENRKSFGLKKLAHSVLKVPGAKIVEFRDVMKRPVQEEYGLFPEGFEKDLADWETKLGTYCINDCKYTYKLFYIFKKKLEEDGLWKEYTELELPFALVLRDMENRGIGIDADYLRDIGKKMEERRIEIHAEIIKEMGGKEIDINSPQQLAKYFQEEKQYGIPNDLRTEKGGFSTNVDVLKYFIRVYGCSVSDKILKYRELAKLHSTYVVSVLEKAGKSGLIHTSFLQHGTKTGRLSSQSPNLTNLPRRNDEFDIKRAFIARPGYTFVISDYSQIELRIAAYYSKDPIMVKAYQEGKDLHQEMADALGLGCIAKCHQCQECRDGRSRSKAISFGILYGMSSYSLSSSLGMTPEEAEIFMQNYFNKFKSIRILMQQAINTMEHHYAVRTLVNRKRRFPEYASAKKNKDWKLVARMKRQVLNSIIQGTGADILKIAMRNLHSVLQLLDGHILVAIHDELVIECPIENSAEVLRITKFEMENALELGKRENNVPLITEPHISPYWNK